MVSRCAALEVECFSSLQALAELEERLRPQGRKVTVVTQNIDGLHHQAGSRDIIELHGVSILRTSV